MVEKVGDPWRELRSSRHPQVFVGDGVKMEERISGKEGVAFRRR